MLNTPRAVVVRDGTEVEIAGDDVVADDLLVLSPGRQVVVDGAVVDEAEDVGDGLEEEIPLERWESFHRAVENLPEEHREVFKLVWYLGADRETAAKTLGLSVRTVGRRWQEARALVAQAVQ